jgi:tol-pal system protein YbgF
MGLFQQPARGAVSEEPHLTFPNQGRVRFSRTLSLPALALAVLAGCAETTPPALQQDLAQIKRDVAAMAISLHRAKTDTETTLGQMDRRAQERSGEIQRNLAELKSRTDAIGGDLGRVEGRLEELRHRVEGLSRSLESGRPGAPAPAAPPPARSTEPPRGTQGSIRPSEVYQTAYIDFTRGNYSLAISGFEEFIKRFSDSELADNAQYWIGEAHFSMARDLAAKGQPAVQAYERAVQEFRKVAINYPRGDKVPSALYKEALTLLELKQQALATARLQYLVDQFPQTEEAALARDRLASLRGSR